MNKKKDKFINIAEKRLEKAIHAIEILKPLADKTRYEYTDTQVSYILRELKKAISDVEKSFKDGNGEKKKITIPRE